MVLRRTLPSRLTGAPPAEAPPAVPAAASAAPETSPSPTTPSNTNAAALAAAAAALMPPVAPPPVPKVEPSPVLPTPKEVTPAEEFMAANALPPRVLEDSFVAVTPTPDLSVTTPTEATAAPTVPATVSTTPEPQTTASAPIAQIADVITPETPVATFVADETADEPLVTAETSAISAAVPTPSALVIDEPVLAAPAATSASTGPTNFLPDVATVLETPVVSKPAENVLRRRIHKPDHPRVAPPPKPITATLATAVAPEPNTIPAVKATYPATTVTPKAARQVTPRDFAAATIVAPGPETYNSPAPALNRAPEIPVDTRPLDRVDEELIASGIIAGPAADSLISQVPTSLAVAETPFSALPEADLGGSLIPPLPGFTLATTTQPITPRGPLPSGLETPGDSHWDVGPATPTPPPDIFKPHAHANLSHGLEGASGSRLPPPTLPEGRVDRVQLAAMGQRGHSWMGTAIATIAFGGIGLFVWYQAHQPGGLETVNNQLAKLTQSRPSPVVPPTSPSLLPPPTQLAGPNTISASLGYAQIEFAAPTPDPNQPIAATGNEPMPEDISVFAKLQREIQNARAARDGTAVASTASGTEPIANVPPITKEQSDQELARYRQLLASADPATAPKPHEFLHDPDAYMDGKANNTPTADPEGALLPPPATQAEQRADGSLPPPNELYTNNPKKLPIVAEPQMQEAPKIRQLADFAAELFPPEAPKVKIPQGVRPKLAATDFPSLEVLSFVPGRGLIASADGKEGVLMVGESLNGWELTGVSADMAEFRAGDRSYVLTAQN